MPSFIGAIDQGTTSTRFVIFDEGGNLITWHQIEFQQRYPRPGYLFMSKKKVKKDAPCKFLFLIISTLLYTYNQ